MDPSSGTMTPHEYDKALSVAVHRRNKDDVQRLLPHAYVNTARYTQVNNYQNLRVLQQEDEDTGFEEYDTETERVLHEAYYINDLEMVEILLQAGAFCDWWTDEEMTFLESAASRGNVEMTRLFIRYGANVNIHVGYGTPLFRASQENQTRTATLLLESGADPNLPRSEFFEFPVVFSIQNRNLELLDAFFRQGVNLSCFNHPEDSSVVTSFLDEAVNTFNNAGHGTPERNKSFTIIQSLLEYNVDWEIQDVVIEYTSNSRIIESSQAVMQLIQRYRHVQTIVYLSELTWEQLNEVDSWGKTALHRAAENGDEDAVDFLLSKNVKALGVDFWGRTPNESALARREWYLACLAKEEDYDYVLKDEVKMIMSHKPFQSIAAKISTAAQAQVESNIRADIMLAARTDYDTNKANLTRVDIAREVVGQMDPDTFRELCEFLRF
jgi:ankyrin repeat protein